VKTLQDRPRLLRVHSHSDRAVRYPRTTNAAPATRLPFERHIFGVAVFVRPSC
jgi:hypothetical protein